LKLIKRDQNRNGKVNNKKEGTAEGQLLLLKGQASVKNQQNEGPGKYCESHPKEEWKLLTVRMAPMCCVIIFWPDHKTCQLAVPSSAENISHINQAKKNPVDS